MSAVKLDKWDVSIGLIMGSWVILHLYLFATLWFHPPVLEAPWFETYLVSLIYGSELVGAVLVLGSGIVVLVRAFQKSKSWGLAALFIPFAALVFVFKHWDESWRPFLTSLLGAAIIMIEFWLSPGLPFVR